MKHVPLLPIANLSQGIFFALHFLIQSGIKKSRKWPPPPLLRIIYNALGFGCKISTIFQWPSFHWSSSVDGSSFSSQKVSSGGQKPDHIGANDPRRMNPAVTSTESGFERRGRNPETLTVSYEVNGIPRKTRSTLLLFPNRRHRRRWWWRSQTHDHGHTKWMRI